MPCVMVCSITSRIPASRDDCCPSTASLYRHASTIKLMHPCVHGLMPCRRLCSVWRLRLHPQSWQQAARKRPGWLTGTGRTQNDENVSHLNDDDDPMHAVEHELHVTTCTLPPKDNSSRLRAPHLLLVLLFASVCGRHPINCSD